jgi:hypothetical protein
MTFFESLFSLNAVSDVYNATVNTGENLKIANYISSFRSIDVF